MLVQPGADEEADEAANHEGSDDPLNVAPDLDRPPSRFQARGKDRQAVTGTRHLGSYNPPKELQVANVTVSFGSDSRSNNAITAAWINSAMQAQERAGQPVCATVRIEGGDINVALPVGQCGGSGGGGKQPNAAESEVLDLYRRRHLDRPSFSPGELEAFVKQAMRL